MLVTIFPLDGVVLIDPEYFQKEGKQDRKGDKLDNEWLHEWNATYFLSFLFVVYAQLLCGFRYLPYILYV